jgi:Flp pilus assembly pilin Flp
MKLRFGNLIHRLQYLMTAECGQDMVEYALIAALIACACFASTSAFANLLRTSYNSISVTFGNYA